MAKYVKNIDQHLDDLRENLERGELNATKLRSQTIFKIIALICLDLILLSISITGTDNTFWIIITIISIGFTAAAIYTLGKVTSHIAFCGTMLDDIDKFMVEDHED